MSSQTPYEQSRNSGGQIRVVHLLDSLDHGGAAQVLVDMVTGLDKQRYAPLVCLTHSSAISPRAQELINHNIPLLMLDRRGPYDVIVWKALLGALSETAILHSHSESSNTWARLWGTLMGVPIIITQEHKAPDRKYLIFKILDRILSPLSTRIIVVSEYDRQRIVAFEGHKTNKVVTIYNGIAAERFALPLSKKEARIRANLPTEGKLLAIIGRLEREKNHELFLEALAQLHKQFSGALHAIIVGSGSRRLELETLVERSGLGCQVSFLGERSDIPIILKAIDGVVISSSWECLPLVTLEALAAKCPVVATDVGGVREALKGGEAGLIVPCGDVLALVNAMIMILEQPEATSAKVDIGYEWVTHRFCKERMLCDLQELYEELLGHRQRNTGSRTMGKQ